MKTRFLLWILCLGVLLVACDGGSPSATSFPTTGITTPRSTTASPTQIAVVDTPPIVTPTTMPSPTATPEGRQMVASGTLELEAAYAFVEAGFHAPVTITHPLPASLQTNNGQRLIISLWDANRPNQTCRSEHPSSGCATLDWADDSNRPKVPANGNFVNRLQVELTTGIQLFYLTEGGTLASVPNTYEAVERYTAIGGSSQEWAVTLPAELQAGSELILNLVMTKQRGPDVKIAYEIYLEG